MPMAPMTAATDKDGNGTANPQQFTMIDQQQMIYQQMALHQQMYQQYQAMLA